MRALTLLAVWQVKNSLRATFTDPKRLVPFLVFAGWLALQTFNGILLTSAHGAAPPELVRGLMQNTDAVAAAAFVLLASATLSIFDAGAGGGLFTFSLADADYIFPAPLSRRLVLAYQLGARTVRTFWQSIFMLYFLLWLPLTAVAPGQDTVGARLGAMGAVFLCLGGYANAAFAAKLIFGFTRDRWTWVTRIVLILAAVVGIIAFALNGVPGLVTLTREKLLLLPFLPCRLAADAITAPILRHSNGTMVQQLGLFYVVTLAVLFTRNENFYEASLEGSERAARILQAVRQRDWSTVSAIRHEARQGRRRKESPYTVPPFGRGGMALLWAHLASAAKRPMVNFAYPVLAGAAMGVLPAFWIPADVAVWGTVGVVAYVMFFLNTASLNAFRRAIARGGLLRPLPIPPWQVLLADVCSQVLILSLLPVSAGIVVLIRYGREAELPATLLLLCMPLATVLFNLVEYMMALLYPDAQDRLQQMVAGFISLFANATLAGGIGLLVALPLLFHAPGWLLAAIFVPVCCGGVVALAFLAGYVYRRVELR